MLQSLRHHRGLLLTGLLVSAAFIVCALAWGRFFSVAAANPSPVRYVDFVSADGTDAPFRQRCAGPSFIESDAAWRFCAYPYAQADGSPQWGLVRFDLEAGEALLNWPLPQDDSAQILSLARDDDGTLALAWGSPDLEAIYRVDPDAPIGTPGTAALGLPADAGPRVSGMAWVGAALEIVTARVDESAVWVSAYGGDAWKTRTASTPDVCSEDMVCDYQFAHLNPEQGWLFLYAVAPVSFDDPAQAEVEFVLANEAGASTPVDSMPRADLDPQQLVLDDAGRLVRFGDLFDNAPGNVVNWSLDAAPFMLHGGTWERVAAPGVTEDQSFYFSNYQLEGGGLKWIPGVRYPTPGWQLDEWLMLRSSGDGISLAYYDGSSGPALAADEMFAVQNPMQVSLLPASDGGYWLLGPNGAYVKADRALERADGLNMFERVGRTFENFDRLEQVNSDFYQTRRVLKMAAFPLVLLSLPAGYLLVVFLRQAQPNKRRWLTVLAQVSAAYLIVATVFIWWYWELMDHF